jgi:hypothetical protein
MDPEDGGEGHRCAQRRRNRGTIPARGGPSEDTVSSLIGCAGVAINIIPHPCPIANVGRLYRWGGRSTQSARAGVSPMGSWARVVPHCLGERPLARQSEASATGIGLGGAWGKLVNGGGSSVAPRGRLTQCRVKPHSHSTREARRPISRRLPTVEGEVGAFAARVKCRPILSRAPSRRRGFAMAVGRPSHCPANGAWI